MANTLKLYCQGAVGFIDWYRSFSACLDAAEEAAVSRLYGAIHFRSANEDGLQAGISIGELTATRYLRRKGNRSR